MCTLTLIVLQHICRDYAIANTLPRKIFYDKGREVSVDDGQAGGCGAVHGDIGGKAYAAERAGQPRGGHALDGIQYAGRKAARAVDQRDQEAVRRAGHDAGRVLLRAGVRRAGAGDSLMGAVLETPRLLLRELTAGTSARSTTR